MPPPHGWPAELACLELRQDVVLDASRVSFVAMNEQLSTHVGMVPLA